MLRIVSTENGKIRGTAAADPRITVFRGIPFAAPPVGKNRWRAPQPCENWEGVRDCLEFAPISVQNPPGVGAENIYTREWNMIPDIPMGEDCLYLNVWTPAKSPKEKLPVMFWIFGGAFQGGHTAEMEFDGERIARRGVILVSVNYRVNVFGFLTHPGLIEEDPDGCWGNYGLLDQLAGLKWVKRNIAAFGGDPDNVTIFGQSAGAGSVICQMTSPLAGGLFHKAIMQSGGGLRAYGQGSRMIPLERAKENGLRFFEELGVKSLEEARQIDAMTLYRKAIAFGGMNVWSPTVDGRFLLKDPSDVFLANEHPDIPCMYGYTGDEYDNILAGSIETLEELKDFARKKFGDKAGDFLQLCNVSTDEQARELYIRDDVFKGRCLNNLTFAMKQMEFGRKGNFVYRFDPSIPGWDDPGAFHSSELWFMFETLAKCWRPFTGKHYDLARIMCNYWTNFAKTGDPNGCDADGSSMPEWREYTKEEPCFLYLSEEEIHMGAEYRTELMQFRLDYIFGGKSE